VVAPDEDLLVLLADDAVVVEVEPLTLLPLACDIELSDDSLLSADEPVPRSRMHPENMNIIANKQEQSVKTLTFNQSTSSMSQSYYRVIGGNKGKTVAKLRQVFTNLI